MVGIVMSARIQATNKKEFEELQRRLETPNTTVDIKSAIQKRINSDVKIHRRNVGEHKC